MMQSWVVGVTVELELFEAFKLADPFNGVLLDDLHPVQGPYDLFQLWSRAGFKGDNLGDMVDHEKP